MNRMSKCFCILILLSISTAGCISDSPGGDQPAGTGNSQPPSPGLPATITPVPEASSNAAVNTSAIPLLFNDMDWKTAKDCGWTEKNISETATLFLGDCTVRRLIADGWKIEGMRYNMNFLGSRCRRTTHPDAPETCDFCLDAGPTLALGYHGVMTTEFMANPGTKRVRHFSTSLPDGAASISSGGSDSVVFRNGTVLYSFTYC